MKRPKKKDYLTTNQVSYQDMLNEYYKELEKYIDYLENELNELDFELRNVESI